MELEHVLGNTWVFKSWELIPFYKVDESHCILLDTGLNDQREDLEESLQREGLTPVGVICSHAHIDHMGNVAYLKEKYGTQLAMSPGGGRAPDVLPGPEHHQLPHVPGGRGGLAPPPRHPLFGRPDHPAHRGPHHLLRGGL